MRRGTSQVLSIGVLASVCLAASGAEGQSSVPQPVSLKAPDGIVLKASYYSPGRPGPGVLLLHMCNSDRSAWKDLASATAAQGYHVLALDYRGYGESGGQRFEDFQQQQPVVEQQWPGDVDAAFAWLTSQAGVDKKRVAAAGASCGVNQSVQLARRHPEVKTVVLLSGNVNAAGREYLRDSPWLPVLAAASHGDGDAVNEMKWILGWSRNPASKFVEYDAAGHGTEMFAAEKGLQPLVIKWFDDNLRNAPEGKPTTVAAVKPTPVEEFWKVLTEPGGAERAKQIYLDTKQKHPNLVLFPEGEANLFGYQLLQGGNAKDAVVVFQMNVDAYPTSANTYDSLADGYLALGNREEALRNAEKALEMLPKDTKANPQFKELVRESAEKKVKDLKKT